MSLLSYENIESTGLVEQRQELERILTTNPDYARHIRTITRRVMAKAAESSSGKLSGQVHGLHDSYKAVRYSVYRRLLGGNVHISPGIPGGAKNRRFAAPPRKLVPGQRGGNRMPRSQRTIDLLSYYGRDRGFVLYFLNGGADRSGYSKTRGKYPYRAHITPRNFFATSVNMDNVAQQLADLIDDEVAKYFNQ